MIMTKLLFLGVFVTFLGALPASATIVLIPQGEGDQPKVQCVRNWNWSFDIRAETDANGCTFFTAIPSSPAGTNVNGFLVKTLSWQLQHTVAPDANEIPKNPPAGPVTINAGDFSLGVSRAGVYVLAHPATDHQDVYWWSVSVPGKIDAEHPGIMSMVSSHRREVFQPGWSYDPGPGRPVNFGSVTATYRTDASKPAEGVPGPDKKIKDPINGKLPNSDSGQRPTDYHVRVSVGDPIFADMTLGFITGSVGSFELGDLGLLNDVIAEGGDYLVPMLFDLAITRGGSVASCPLAPSRVAPQRPHSRVITHRAKPREQIA